MSAEYRFLDEWQVPLPIGRVYELVGEPLRYPEWWGAVFLAAEGGGGLPEPGKATSVVARGFLPYRLRFTITCTAAVRPTRIESALSGDFDGTGTWLLEEAPDGGTRAQLDWRPVVNKPFVRQLTPVLRPLFRANHNWTMRRGDEAIHRLAAQA